MEFDKYGYFSSEINDLVTNTYNTYKDLFDSFFELNNYAQENKFKYVIHRDKVQEELVAAIFIKTIDSLQSSVILAIRGLDSDAKVLLRVAIESLFILKAICDDEKVAHDYLKSEKKAALRMMNAINSDQNKVFSDYIKKAVTKEEIDLLDEEVRSNNIQEYQAWEMAKKSGLVILYDYVYRILNNEVHTSIKSLDKYLKVDENGEIEFIEVTPKTNDIPQILVTIFTIYIETLSCTNSLFIVDNKYIEDYTEKIKVLFEKYKVNYLV